MIQKHHTRCPKCGSRDYKDCLDLDDGELAVAYSITMLKKYGDLKRRKHYICMQCFHIEVENETIA